MICRCAVCQINLRDIAIRLRKSNPEHPPVVVVELPIEKEQPRDCVLSKTERLKRLKEMHKCRILSNVFATVPWTKYEDTLEELRAIKAHYEITNNEMLTPVSRALHYMEKMYTAAEACNFSFPNNGQ